MLAGRIRIALLDDHRVFLESLEALLERAGLEVVARCANVEELLTQMGRAAPDVALIDLRLESAEPGEVAEGLHALELLRDLYPSVRSLVLSACGDWEVMERCFQAGAAGYLCKRDVGGGDLRDAIERVARGEWLVPPDLLAAGQARADQRSTLERLTPREREVLGYVAVGADNLQIAASLHITERTVKAHITSLYRKLGAQNRTRMAILALQLGVARPPERR
ncbi:response regulator transcription factor [Archangium sp.]|uniref:response regulator transcription factor n=1 Tax=Archangium sp. TaxID=1872627 RepID=UPI002D3C5364|nr:response regulator transcription factor [Archangium sp.]HYO55881.1 response regulator transcription factor [Archangium sp.]